MKTHYRRVRIGIRTEERPFKGPELSVPCGSQNVRWTEHTTKDVSKVTCKRCLAAIGKEGKQ